MASIYGFSLKGRKTFQGTDGIGNQGNLYYENKKVAWYNDYADGSMATLDFYNGAKGREEYVPILQDAIKKYYERFPMEEAFKHLTPDEEFFMSDLLLLMDEEKQYKKVQKGGYKYLATYQKKTDRRYYYEWSNDEKFVEKTNARTDIANLKIYSSLEDFEIK